jgi:ribosomal protein S27E
LTKSALEGLDPFVDQQTFAEPNAQANDFECIQCGAQMAFDAAHGCMSCQYCGNTMAVAQGEQAQEAQEEIVEHDLEHGIAQSAQRGLGVEVRTTECRECGARVSFEGAVTATFCEFCGSTQVMEQQANRNLIRPESLLPFGVDQDSAKSRFKSWLSGLWFRPSDLKQRASLGQIAGVYVPYWTFDAQADSRWTAQAGYYYYTEEQYKAPDGSTKTRRVRHTRWQPAWGSRRDHYDDVLVCASKGLPVDLAESLKTFDTRQLVAYAPGYLAGWRAEEYALPLNEGWGRANRRMQDSQRSRCSGDVPGDTQRGLNVTTRLSQTTFKHILLPLFIASYRYNDEVYRFVVNGQTGEISGKAPYSWIKIAAAVILALTLVACLIGGMSLVSSN